MAPRDVPGTALTDGAGASTMEWDAEGLKGCWRVLGTLAPKGSRQGTRGCQISAPSWWHGGVRTCEVARCGSGLRLQQHHPHTGKVSAGCWLPQELQEAPCKAARPSETPQPEAEGAEQPFLQQETPRSRNLRASATHTLPRASSSPKWDFSTAPQPSTDQAGPV